MEAWQIARQIRTAQGALGQAEGHVDNALKGCTKKHIALTLTAARALMESADDLLVDALVYANIEEEENADKK